MRQIAVTLVNKAFGEVLHLIERKETPKGRAKLSLLAFGLPERI